MFNTNLLSFPPGWNQLHHRSGGLSFLAKRTHGKSWPLNSGYDVMTVR